MWGGAALLSLGLVGTTVGCSGGQTPEASDGPATETAAGPTVDASGTWAVGMADETTWTHLQKPGWITFVSKRELKGSSEQLGMEAARVHAEAAAMFRQAALLSTRAAIQAYEKTPQPTDPVGAAHLLAVAHSLEGDLDAARAASARLDGVEDVTTPWHAPWKAWLAGEAVWPPDLSGLAVELPPMEPGNWPVITDSPQYKLPVQGAGDHAQDMGDPGLLVALALWHDGMARKLAGEDADAVALYTARYRFPVEKAPVATATLPESFLYASDFLVAGDAAFMADVMGEKGAAAVAAHEKTSLLARLSKQARKDGKVDAEKAVDVAVALRADILAKSEAKSGSVKQHHRWFADMAHVGTLRNLALLAEVEGDRETSGKLRILAMEASIDHASDPAFLMSLAAWDVRNRYPMRAQEFVHRHEKFYPSLEAARFGLDVLALRVSRERVETPGM
jgi:uncharacterized protein (DUF2267 family)